MGRNYNSAGTSEMSKRKLRIKSNKSEDELLALAAALAAADDEDEEDDIIIMASILFTEDD
jgi:hypothetical protein